MRISKTTDHPIRKKILRSSRYSFCQYRHCCYQVILQIMVKLISEVRIVIDYYATVSRAFRPYSCFGVKAIISQLSQTPLADARTIHHVVNIVFASFSIRILFIIFQHQSHIHDISCLQQIPIIMRYSISYNIICPFLQCSGINYHLVRIVGFQIIIQEVIQRNDNMQGIFMNHFKRRQPYQCLLMPVIQVNRYLSIINPRHISIEDTGSQFCILFLPRHPVEESGITGNSQYLTIQILNITSGLGRMYTLQRTTFQGIVAESHISVFIIIIRYYILEFRATVCGSRSPCSGITYGRSRRLFTSGMVEHFSLHVDFRRMQLPIHCQTG